MANLLNTRIALRYDLFSNWQNSEVILLAGEVAVAVPGDKLADVATGLNDHGASVPCLIKVGDGVHKFSELPWLSALAADVHTWAKKSEAEFKTWLTTDTNGPKLATASDLAAAAGRISTLEGKVKTLEETTVPGIANRVGTLEGEMDTAQDDINTLKTKVGEGEGSLGAAINGLTTRMGNAEKAITDHASEYSELASDVQENTTAIALLNNTNKDTVGSVAYAVEQEAIRAKAAEKVNSDAIAVLNGTADTTNSVAHAVKTAIDQEVIDRNSAIAGLKTELNNGTIKTAQEKANSAYDLADSAKDLADENKTKVDTLIGADSGKSVRTIANEELAAQLIPENAADALDTLQEIAAWIQEHPEDAAQMNADIGANATNISNLTEDLGKLTTRVGTNETNIGNINTKIGTEALYGEHTTLIGAINAIANADAGNHAATLKSAKDYTDAEVKKATDAHTSDLTALKSDIIGTPTEGKTIVEMIAAAEAAAKSHAETKASAAESAAKSHAETKATAAENAAKAYTDTEIDKVESAIAVEKKAREDFDKTAITGALGTADANGNQTLTLALDGKNLEIVFVCGNATV